MAPAGQRSYAPRVASVAHAWHPRAKGHMYHAWHLSPMRGTRGPKVICTTRGICRPPLHLPRVDHLPGVRSEAQDRHDTGGAQLVGCYPAETLDRIASNGHWHLRVWSFRRDDTRQRKKSGHLLQSTVRPCCYSRATRGHTPLTPPPLTWR